MEKAEIVKSIIYQIFDENTFISKAINGILERESYNCIEIYIVFNRYCVSFVNYGKITIGIPDIIDFYKLSRKIMSCHFVDKLFFMDNYTTIQDNEGNREKIIIHISSAEKNEIDKQLEDSDIYKSEHLSVYDMLTKYALAYSLFHEVGHFVYEKTTSELIKREFKADIFAFKAIKSIPSVSKDKDNTKLLGIFIGISQVLLGRDSSAENNDTTHPHSIERLYKLLNYWKISEKSPYWELAHKVVCDWSKKNHLPMTWEKDTSFSYKDKFKDAYLFFKKRNND